MPQVPAINYGIVAGIVGPDGGLRVVVGTPNSVGHNIEPGEKAYIVPGLWWQDPVPWEHKEYVIRRVERHVLAELAPVNHCGDCKQCCITLYIADDGDGFSKRSHSNCRHLCDKGCSLYWRRPKTCRAFKCYWLKSQDGNRPLAPELRPDRCGSILTDHEDGPIRIHTDQSIPRSEALQAFVVEREAEGERFDQVTHYYGETS